MFNPQDDDDDDLVSLDVLYNEGQWEWDPIDNKLVFVRLEECLPVLSVTQLLGQPLEFKDEIDILEEVKFKKRFQRANQSCGEDFVTLQDVKDVVLFSAPLKVTTLPIVTVLHKHTTERFLRILIFYCQYYLQVTEDMARRMLLSDIKIETWESRKIQKEFENNLQDMRLLIADEYSSFLLGGQDLKNYHHMGKNKKRSMSHRDAHFFEIFFRVCIQIAWIALGRKSFDEIDVEMNRIFKTDIYNTAKHRMERLERAQVSDLIPEARPVILGTCVGKRMKLYARSPIINEIRCTSKRSVDYRKFGLGVYKYHRLSSRQQYFQRIKIEPEATLHKYNLSLGIIGLPRSRFDTMLRELPQVAEGASSSVKCRTSFSRRSSRSSKSRVSTTGNAKLFPDIILPEKTYESYDLQDLFPNQLIPQRECNQIQKNKWLLFARSYSKKVTRNRKAVPITISQPQL